MARVKNQRFKIKRKMQSCLSAGHDGVLMSVLDGGKWSASHPDRLTPEEIRPGTHQTRGQRGSREGLENLRILLPPLGTK